MSRIDTYRADMLARKAAAAGCTVAELMARSEAEAAITRRVCELRSSRREAWGGIARKAAAHGRWWAVLEVPRKPASERGVGSVGASSATTAPTVHRTVLTNPRPQPTPCAPRRTITSDPPKPGPSTGWGWKCLGCGSHDTGYATSWTAIEAAEYHRGSP